MKQVLPSEIYVKFERDGATVGTEPHEVCDDPGVTVQVGVYRLHRTARIKCKAEEV